MDLSHLDHLHVEDIKQKCRLRWALEGDENSRFFHSTMKFKYAKSSINGINVNGIWVVNREEIKAAALEHFASRFKENVASRPKFRSARFRKLSPSDMSFLDSTFTIAEIKSAVWVLASRLARVISSLIGSNQTAFIGGRQILDGCLVVNEIIRMLGVPAVDVEQVAGSLGCAFDKMPFMYLGLPVGRSMRACGGWSEVIDRFNVRLSAWNAKNLSIGGRLTLMKSVLRLAKGICWIKWDSIMLDANLGGLGVGSIGAKNLSLLAKWKWRFLTEKDSLWRIVIKKNYGDDGGFGSPANPWCGIGVRLKDSFPRLYALENNQDCKVKDRWCLYDGVWGGNWSWRLPPRGRAVSDLNALVSVIGNFSLDDSRVDSWSWSWDASGMFKVKSLATCVQNSVLSGCVLGKYHIWNMLIPHKVNICVWRAALNRLPSRLNLSSRGVPLSSSLCPFCDDENEDLEHGLIKCSKVVPVWSKIWSWWGLATPTFFPSFSIKDIALGKIGSISCTKTSKVLQGRSNVHCGLFGSGETKWLMLIMMLLMALERKISSPLYRGYQKIGSRPALNHLSPTGAVGLLSLMRYICSLGGSCLGLAMVSFVCMLVSLLYFRLFVFF
nr:RNA-directed DNA polymerase, eukaryota, reverse transcriptase zinc-binding domain protein [Tanacetum cinerariifolium]